MMTLPTNNKRQAKAIEQLDLQGNVIKEWESTAEAFRALNINKGYIIAVMKGRREEAGGYRWRYKDV